MINERAGLNLYQFVETSSPTSVALHGLDIINNSTGGPVIAFGNSGHDSDAFFFASHGVNDDTVYVLTPAGTTSEERKEWDNIEDAINAAWNSSMEQLGIDGVHEYVPPPNSIDAVSDIDGYVYQDGVETRLRGDYLGPRTTLTVDENGNIDADSDLLGSIGAKIRNGPRGICEILLNAGDKLPDLVKGPI